MRAALWLDGEGAQINAVFGDEVLEAAREAETKIARKQGFLTEEDMDNLNVPKATYQSKAEAKGQLRDKWPWTRQRAVWLNAEGTLAKRETKRREAQEAEAERARRADKRAREREEKERERIRKKAKREADQADTKTNQAEKAKFQEVLQRVRENTPTKLRMGD